MARVKPEYQCDICGKSIENIAGHILEIVANNNSIFRRHNYRTLYHVCSECWRVQRYLDLHSGRFVGANAVVDTMRQATQEQERCIAILVNKLEEMEELDWLVEKGFIRIYRR